MTPRYYVLDDENHVVEVFDLVTWGEFMEGGNRTVGYTEITSAITVSTIFLGLDHRLYGDGPPILFETLVFGGPLDGQSNRYSSYDDAEVGHRMMVAKARAAQTPEKSNGPGNVEAVPGPHRPTRVARTRGRDESARDD